MAFSPDGRTVASGDFGGAIRLRDVSIPARSRILVYLQIAGSVNSLAFSPDGRTLAVAGSPNISGSGGIWLWDVTKPADPRMLGEPLSPNGQALSQDAQVSVDSVAFSPDGGILASGGSVYNHRNTIQLWDMRRPARPRPLGRSIINGGDGSAIRSLTFSTDSRTLASNEIIGPQATTTTQLWDVSNAAHPRLLGRPPAIGNDDNSDSVRSAEAASWLLAVIVVSRSCGIRLTPRICGHSATH